MNIVLIGFMGSGKTKVGKLLAQRLKWPHYDTDDLISKAAGASIADIINKQGEAAFRSMEQAVVAKISMKDKGVISTGGGVPLDPQNMEALKKNGTVVWLKVSSETALKRAGDLKSRPLIDPENPLGSIQKRMAERASAYGAASY